MMGEKAFQPLTLQFWVGGLEQGVAEAAAVQVVDVVLVVLLLVLVESVVHGVVDGL